MFLASESVFSPPQTSGPSSVMRTGWMIRTGLG